MSLNVPGGGLPARYVGVATDNPSLAKDLAVKNSIVPPGQHTLLAPPSPFGGPGSPFLNTPGGPKKENAVDKLWLAVIKPLAYPLSSLVGGQKEMALQSEGPSSLSFRWHYPVQVMWVYSQRC
jgi:hypothetical protein